MKFSSKLLGHEIEIARGQHIGQKRLWILMKKKYLTSQSKFKSEIL
ncbi:hypothetical protein E3A20_18560 [Planctomyces bekefii]|uniref:Uncharacterized protein n=1 Tax=Planctomyces bekefii TaxID=1653850 RepID=A0A5C6M2S7_9PLAN|nr:hypothetical protein E3A20_18560 [Planctomyces bekefii]